MNENKNKIKRGNAPADPDTCCVRVDGMWLVRSRWRHEWSNIMFGSNRFEYQEKKRWFLKEKYYVISQSIMYLFFFSNENNIEIEIILRPDPLMTSQSHRSIDTDFHASYLTYVLEAAASTECCISFRRTYMDFINIEKLKQFNTSNPYVRDYCLSTKRCYI